MRNQEWNSTLAQLDTPDTAQLVFGLLGGDAVDGEATLGVVDKTEVLASLVDGDHVHEAGRVGDVGADLSIDLDVALHHNALGLAVVEGILEAVADEDDQGQAVPGLVRAGAEAQLVLHEKLEHLLNSRCLGRIGTGKFVKQPVRGRTQAVLMLLRSTSHLG